MRDLPRSDRAAEAAELRGRGLTYQRIADAMGISRSYANDLLLDPDGSKTVARKRRYQGTCEDCGGPTDGSLGRAKAPKRCAACNDKHRAAQHGTRSKYDAGCRCAPCTAANTAYMRGLRGKPAPSHGLSGYINYGCRCDVCRKAGSDNNWLRYPEKRRANGAA